ncbi:MAG: LAGLIDADG family homing endonuclease, partial [Thermoplasmata archaeon]
AIRSFVPPTEEAEIRFRVRGVPRDLRVEVRDLRAKHLGKLVSVEGLVRKATEVRPRLVEAVFQCLRCGAVIKEAQEGLEYHEPLECYDDQGGCGRSAGSTKFKLLDEGSRYIDTQKIEIQEPPEELRGGEAPQRLAGYLEEDLVGLIFPGDRVVINGLLRGSQRGRFRARSTLFDIFVDVVGVEMEEVEYEEIEITPEDKERIEKEAASGDIIRKIVGSIAPSIYGMNVEKEALALQLFGGVAKKLPDGRRIRGDTHLLLVGDPGTGKSELLTYMTKLSPRGIYASGKAATAAGLCVTGETLVHTAEGLREIGNLVAEHIPSSVTSETAAEHSEVVYTLRDHRVVPRSSSLVWRMPQKSCYKLTTNYGKEIEASEKTRLLTCGENGLEWKRIRDIHVGDFVAAPDYSLTVRTQPGVGDYVEYENERLRLTSDSIELLRSRLRRQYGTLREAARQLGLAEDVLYSTLPRRFIPYPKLAILLESTGTSPGEIQVEKIMLRHGWAFRLPREIDAEMMYLLGLVFGDGDIQLDDERGLVRFSSADEELLLAAQGIFRRRFGRELRIESDGRKVRSLRLYSKTIARFFSNLGMSSPKRNLALDPALTASPFADAFLRGLMDTDGCVVDRQG